MIIAIVMFTVGFLIPVIAIEYLAYKSGHRTTRNINAMFRDRAEYLATKRSR